MPEKLLPTTWPAVGLPCVDVSGSPAQRPVTTSLTVPTSEGAIIGGILPWDPEKSYIWQPEVTNTQSHGAQCACVLQGMGRYGTGIGTLAQCIALERGPES